MGDINTSFSKSYFAIVLLFMFVLPVLSVLIEYYNHHEHLSIFNMSGKWFVFWAVGIRLFTAGCKQVLSPSFTAKEIFHIKSEESAVIVRELGFGNICLGSMGIISLFIPAWQTAAAFSGGLFFGIAGIGHLIKKPVSANEWIAMVSDIFIFLVMAAYLVHSYVLS